MANVYKISKDPQGLFKKPPTYFFRNYKGGRATENDLSVQDNGVALTNASLADNLRTKDVDDLVSVAREDETGIPDDGTVIYGITSTPPEKVVKPGKVTTGRELDETDMLMMKTFASDEAQPDDGEHDADTKRKKRRGEKLRSTIQVDEDIRSLYDAEEEEKEVKLPEEKTSSIPGEVDHGPLLFDDDDDNPYNDEDDEAAETYDNDEYDEPDIGEYTDPEDADKFKQHYRTKSLVDLLLGVGAVIALFALLYIESFSFMPSLPRPAFLKPENFRLVLILVDIQLLVIAGALVYESIIDGAKALFSGNPNRNTVTVSAIFVCLLHAVFMCFTSNAETLSLYSSVGALFAVISAFSNAMENKRNLCTFNIISGEQVKFVAEKTDGSDGELNELGDYLPQDPDIFSLKKAKFVDDAVRNIKTPARAEQNCKIIIPLALIAAVVYAVITYFVSYDLNKCINAFTVMSLVALPASSLIYIALPYLVESLKIAKRGCAVIGGDSFEEYSYASVVSFNDVEVLPSRGIKVTSVRTYGEHRIDHTLMYAARVFKTVGGPLASVFENYIKNAVDEISPVEIISIEHDGISAVVDGTEVFIGKKNFMLAYNFGFVKDSMDDAFENSIGRIMYMTIGDNIAAKFYIKYSIYKGFEKLLTNLEKVGICVGIKTCDPNIDDMLLKKLLRRKEFPVRIIKSEAPLPSDDVLPNASSGIVCTSNAFNMLRAFLSCDKLAKNVSLNIGTKFIAMFLAFAIIAFLSVINGGDISGITPQFIIIYQLLWLMPCIATALLG
ncbi:MAG: hypothetical protein E7588_07185 [Ruminococcaceae bacterium]|nr:hypothetical protein [Oscillospiraceae bacterium]